MNRSVPFVGECEVRGKTAPGETGGSLCSSASTGEFGSSHLSLLIGQEAEERARAERPSASSTGDIDSRAEYLGRLVVLDNKPIDRTPRSEIDEARLFQASASGGSQSSGPAGSGRPALRSVCDLERRWGQAQE